VIQNWVTFDEKRQIALHQIATREENNRKWHVITKKVMAVFSPGGEKCRLEN